jgi:hypothetical protein
MEEAEIMEILTDWNVWGNYKHALIERGRYLKKVSELAGKEVLVLKGIRRAGKSSIAYLLLQNLVKNQKNCLVINFEDPRFPETLSVKDLIRIHEVYLRVLNPSKNQIVVLDEVQKVNKWESFARLLSETKKAKVIVTGSSSKLMSAEYASLLTGRHLDVEVFPLSFEEFLYFNNIKITNQLSLIKNKNKIFHMLYEYIHFGGFPEVVLAKNDVRKKELLTTYYNDIITKDVAQRFKIKETKKLLDLSKMYISNISTIQSLRKLKKLVGLSLDSVERFSKYFDTASLFSFLPKFGFSVKTHIKSMKKVYVADVGFYNVFGFKFSQNIGRIIENVVFIELVRRKSLQKTSEIYYYKNNHSEVDFVVKQNRKIKQLIQVCYNIDDYDTKQRELKALIKASKELKCNNLLTITWDYEAKEEFKEKKIRFVPLWKWLLEI